MTSVRAGSPQAVSFFFPRAGGVVSGVLPFSGVLLRVSSRFSSVFLRVFYSFLGFSNGVFLYSSRAFWCFLGVHNASKINSEII